MMILDNNIGTKVISNIGNNHKITLTENDNYTYMLFHLSKENEIYFEMKYMYLFFLSDHLNSELMIYDEESSKKNVIKSNFGIEFYKKSKIKVKSNYNGILFFCGTNSIENDLNITEYKLYDKFYTVNKPWGKEFWLNEEGKPLSFKKILINQGHQTSLQYHQYKCETNLLFEGNIDFVYSNSFANELKIENDLSALSLNEISYMQIDYNNIHRIKANSQTTLFEVSTPHLDDVIRVSDDTNRVSGRIKSEHN